MSKPLPREELTNDFRVNRLAIMNGFTSTTEVADILGLYNQELRCLVNVNPVELLNLIIRAKRIRKC